MARRCRSIAILASVTVAACAGLVCLGQDDDKWDAGITVTAGGDGELGMPVPPDVPWDHWAYDAIAGVLYHGIVRSEDPYLPEAGTFKGEETVSRYELALVADRLSTYSAAYASLAVTCEPLAVADEAVFYVSDGDVVRLNGETLAEEHTYDMGGEVEGIVVHDGSAYFVAADRLHCVDPGSLDTVHTVDLPGLVLSIVRSGEHVLVLTEGAVTKLDATTLAVVAETPVSEE